MKRLLCAAFLIFPVACSDSVDRAAKRRIFSPEDPPQAVAAASEKIPVDQLSKDPRLARRALEMGAAESVERLGAHQFEATAAFEWSLGERNVQLSETRTLVSGPGGVSGDFHGVMVNSRDQGFEVWRVNGQVFANNRYGKSRQRLRDRGMAERSREDLRGVLRQVNSLFHGRICLSPAGSQMLEGRPALKFSLSLDPPSSAETRPLPPPLVLKGAGPDEGTRLRQAFFKLSQPTGIAGELWVDQATAVVLKAGLEGTLTVPQDAGPIPQLKVKVDLQVGQIGQDPKLSVPPDALADADKPAGIADALDRFGIPRSGQDGGTPMTGLAEPPDEDEAIPKN